jgi:elongation factor 2
MADDNVVKFGKAMANPKNIRNICTSAHIHHGKTAFTDNLLAASGYMNEKNAGDLDAGMATWQHADEQERLMTVDSANVSMIHDYEGEDYLINLIDTPGHVDFGGNVTRAMRAIDGTIVLVCASEGIMPQTETVMKQALKERVKPVLFINKVDRLIKEMCYTPEQIQKRFVDIILKFNQLIERIAEKEFKEIWKVSIQEGSVAFGSARDNWAMSLTFMKKNNVGFKDILKIYEMDKEEREKWIWDNVPLNEVMLDMAIKHLPDPVQAQKYRIPKIWHGEKDSEMGKDLITTNKDGKLAYCITRVMVEARSGREIAAGRLFSGTIKNGQEVWLNGAKRKAKIQQVLMYNGIKTQQMDEVVAGNVLAVMGLNADAGETVTLEESTPFEGLKHIFEPVITKAIAPEKAQDLAKIIDVLKTVSREDPSIKIKVNEETGECLMSGMGELHLEIVENRIKTEKGVAIKSSPPLVVYREAINKESTEFEGKSPNKHNKFYVTVEPIPDDLYALIKNEELPEGKVRKKDDTIPKRMMEYGWDSKAAKSIKDIYKGCILIDNSRGIVYINEVMELIIDAFEQVVDAGPLAREPGMRMMVRVADMKLHEDSIHRGPAQVYPAMREAIRGAMVQAVPVIYEPLQILQIDATIDHMGDVTKLVANKRGQMIDMTQDEHYVSIKAKLPVAEMFGLSSEVRSATEGKGTFFVLDQAFEKLPMELQQKVIKQIRIRKGLDKA